MPRKFKKTTLITIVVAIILITAAFIWFKAQYTGGGVITEIGEDSIAIEESAYGTISVFQLEKKSRFYDAQGNEIPLSGLKVGDYVKVKLFPRVYGRIFLVRKQRTVRWIKVLPE